MAVVVTDPKRKFTDIANSSHIIIKLVAFCNTKQNILTAGYSWLRRLLNLVRRCVFENMYLGNFQEFPAR